MQITIKEYVKKEERFLKFYSEEALDWIAYSLFYHNFKTELDMHRTILTKYAEMTEEQLMKYDEELAESIKKFEEEEGYDENPYIKNPYKVTSRTHFIEEFLNDWTSCKVLENGNYVFKFYL